MGPVFYLGLGSQVLAVGCQVLGLKGCGIDSMPSVWSECQTRNFQVARSNLTAGHLQATNEQVADPWCAQVNSVSYPLRDGK